MTIVSQPEVTLSLASADLAVANTDQKILVVAQQADAGGSATALALSQQIGGDRAEDGLYGRTSHAALIVREIKRYAPQLHIDAIGVDNSGGVARVFTIALGTGPSTAAGTITLTVGSEKNHKFTYTTPAVGEAAAATATAIAALVEADLDCPYSAAAATTNVVLTADNKGTVANSDPIGTTGTAVGLAITQTETTPGSTDPTIATTIFDVIGSERYQQIVWGWDAAATVTTIKTFLDARFNTTNKILDGVAYIFAVDTFANHITALDLLNSNSLAVNVDKLESETNFDGPAVPEMGLSKSAQLAGIAALRMTDGASIARFVTTTSSLDQFGGTALASLPYFNTPLPNMPLLKVGRGFTDVEIESLHDSGGYVMGLNVAGNAGIVGEVVTTFKTDAGGNPDPTWKYLNYVHTGTNVREYFFNNLKKRFVQSRLTQGAVSRGRDMVNEQVFRAFTEKLYLDLAGANFVLVQDGAAAITFFKDNLTVVLDLSLGKITSTMLVPIVTQARIIIATIKISFSTEV